MDPSSEAIEENKNRRNKESKLNECLKFCIPDTFGANTENIPLKLWFINVASAKIPPAWNNAVI
jgi:hypothetical protein